MEILINKSNPTPLKYYYAAVNQFKRNAKIWSYISRTNSATIHGIIIRCKDFFMISDATWDGGEGRRRYPASCRY